MGQWPDRIDPATIESRIGQVLQEHCLMLDGSHPLAFEYGRDMLLLDENLPYHPNAMSLEAMDGRAACCCRPTIRLAAALSSSRPQLMPLLPKPMTLCCLMSSTVLPSYWPCAKHTV